MGTGACMRIIGVIGRKGGSGKTTLAVHLAAELSARGERVTLVDADPQGSAAHWAEPGQLPMPVEHRPIGADVPAWSRWVRSIHGDGFVVLDSPPHLDSALGAVIGLSHVAVLPCGPSGLDLVATAETVGLVRDIRNQRGAIAPLMILVPNRVDKRTASGRELRTALADMGEPVGPDLHARTAYADSFNAGAWVGAYAPDSPAHREIRVLTDQVIKRMGELV